MNDGLVDYLTHRMRQEVVQRLRLTAGVLPMAWTRAPDKEVWTPGQTGTSFQPQASSQSMRFTGAHGVPKSKIGLGRGKVEGLVSQCAAVLTPSGDVDDLEGLSPC